MAGGLETVAIMKEICYYTNVMVAKDDETEKESLCRN